ncbi:hypothetical protein REPUB_Repub01dG0228800 [Reevesia pubescens]
MSRAKTIHKFSLDLKLDWTVDEEHLKIWISAAIRRDFKDLKLNLCCIGFPSNVFACKTLVSLELYDNVLDVPTKVHFPCLKILSLRVVFSNNDFVSRLLSSCLISEDFTVERVRHYDVLVLDINVPSLKGITVKRPSYRYARCSIGCKLQINGPLLEMIKLKDEIVEICNKRDCASMIWY